MGLLLLRGAGVMNYVIHIYRANLTFFLMFILALFFVLMSLVGISVPVMKYTMKKDVEVCTSAREVLDDTDWIFYTCDYSAIGYGDYRWENPIISWNFRENQSQLNVNDIIKL